MHPLFRDLGVTIAAQVAVAIGGLLVYRLLAINTGTDGFASYSLVKQAVLILFPVVTVGLVGGLPRYIALPGRPGGPSAGAYLIAGAAISAAATGVACAVALVFAEPTAALFFGDSGRSELVPAFAALLAATSTFYVAYGYFRGLLRMRAGSLLQVVGLAASPPLVVVLFPGEDVSTLILLMALALGVVSLAAIGPPLARSLRAGRDPAGPEARGALWDYGHRRVPGELAQLGLFASVPILAAHVTDLTEVAYLSAGQQVLSIFSLAVIPLGLVLLPALARMWEEDRARASGHVAKVSALAFHLAIFVSVQAILYADILVRLWLGSGFDDAGEVVRVVVAPGGLFIVYLMLRSTLDAVEVRSFNSRNNLIALAVFGATAVLLLGLDPIRPVMSVAWAFAAGVTVQGLLTFATVHRLFSLSGADYSLGLALALGAITGVAGLAARQVIDDSGAVVLLLLALEAVLAAFFFGVLFRARVGWSVLLRDSFFSRRI